MEIESLDSAEGGAARSSGISMCVSCMTMVASFGETEWGRASRDAVPNKGPRSTGGTRPLAPFPLFIEEEVASSTSLHSPAG